MPTPAPVHDPKIKQQLKDALYELLYQPVQRRFKERLDAIIRHNVQLLSSPFEAFTYKGEVYKIDPQARVPLHLDRLDSSLRPIMDSYLAEVEKLNREELPFAVGYITKVLNASNDLHDYIKLLPESLHPVIQQAIDRCPCRTEHLGADEVKQFQADNDRELQILKQRLLHNLLLP